MKRAFFILVFCLPLLFTAQEIKKLNSRVTLRGNIGIPQIFGSKMFRTSFSGVLESGLSVNIRAVSNFYIGGGYQYTGFSVNKKDWAIYYLNPQNTSTSVFYKTTLVGNSGFLKFGYDYFFSNIGYVSYGVNAGYMSAVYSKILPDTSAPNRPFMPTSFSAPYLQPELAFNFLAEKHVSFSIMLSYTTLFYRFDPRAPRFNHVGEVREERNRANMNWLNISIGFNILLGK
jgi:hypothetical protein